MSMNFFANLANVRARKVAVQEAPKEQLVPVETKEQRIARISKEAVFYEDQQDALYQAQCLVNANSAMRCSEEAEAANAEAVQEVFRYVGEELKATQVALAQARQRRAIAVEAMELQQSVLAQLIKDNDLPSPVAERQAPVQTPKPMQGRQRKPKPPVAPAPVVCRTCGNTFTGTTCSVCLSDALPAPAEEVEVQQIVALPEQSAL